MKDNLEIRIRDILGDVKLYGATTRAEALDIIADQDEQLAREERYHAAAATKAPRVTTTTTTTTTAATKAKAAPVSVSDEQLRTLIAAGRRKKK